jgi:transcriptional regulator GlxA family with amidase domain
VVTALAAPFGPKLAASEKVTVTLTVDSGAEDAQVRASQGAEGLRRGRLLRLTDEALAQGGVLTQEDLARLLGVDRRTIERDVRALKAAGHSVATRGTVKSVGRGQTHKVKIIELWLNGEGYDKISRWVHHSPQAIQRYVKTFLRLVALHREGKSVAELAFLTQTTPKLVGDYLALYEAAMAQPHQREKLAEELARVGLWPPAEPEKGGLSR